uniref:Innexin n=1 Tax=Strongyloides papillosus TaxID=174720 RepID=A0A0N5B7R1_STREA
MNHQLGSQLSLLINKTKDGGHDDDTVDRINYAKTAFILAGFALFVMAIQNIGDPITCWVPAEYPETWNRYIRQYCFVENTYYANISYLPNDVEERENNEIIYYQWIPYILAGQAFLAYLPKLIFMMTYSFSETNISDLIQTCFKETRAGQKDQVEKTNSLLVRKLYQLPVQKNPTMIKSTIYLTTTYLGQKVIAIIFLFCQLLILNFFIQSNDIFWGFKITYKLLSGYDWRVTKFFPRVTFCDLETRDLGQSRKHTLQCILPYNMFIEKIYIFLWIFFFFMIIVSVLNLFYWLYRIFNRESKYKMVKSALKIQDDPKIRSATRDDIDCFINKTLLYDGATVLRLVESNSGYVNMVDLCAKLFESREHCNKYE